MGKAGVLLLAVRGVALSVSPAVAELIYAAVAGNILLSFDSATPLTQSQVPITGLQAGESILGIDLRPATGQLYALGSTAGCTRSTRRPAPPRRSAPPARSR